MSNLSPKRPYFIRALHEWLTDNDFTPYIAIDANHKDLVAPVEFANNGVLTLAFSYQATLNLVIDNEFISFSARFGGISKDIWIPMQAILAVFAKEDPSHALFFNPTIAVATMSMLKQEDQSHALFFDPSEYDGYTPKDTKSPPKSETLKKDSPKKPKAGSPLRIIK